MRRPASNRSKHRRVLERTVRNTDDHERVWPDLHTRDGEEGELFVLVLGPGYLATVVDFPDEGEVAHLEDAPPASKPDGEQPASDTTTPEVSA